VLIGVDDARRGISRGREGEARWCPMSSLAHRLGAEAAKSAK
jgi:hypothetical protein